MYHVIYLQAIALVCLSNIQPSFCYEQTNAGGDIIFEYLGIDPKSVSSHRLTEVNVSRLHKRDLQQGTAITFQAIDEEISLWLRPLDSMLASDETPVYYAHFAPGYPNAVLFEEVENAMKGVRQLLEDPDYYATVVLGTDDSGKTTVNGHLRSPRNNARLVISSLPEHIVKGFLSNKASINDINDQSANLTYHVIVEINDEDDFRHFTGPHRTELDVIGLNNTAAGNAKTTGDQAPETIYPQILVQMDHTSQKRWSDKGLSHFLEYILSFWNGVDLIYRQVQNPKIRFNIAGIIIANDIRATRFFWNNMVVTDVSYNLTSVMNEASVYYYVVEKFSPMVEFDAVAVMTDMKGVFSTPAQTHNEAWGFVVGLGTICLREDATMRSGAVAVIADNGAHAGIHTAAHEIGHLLGAFHEDLPGQHLNCSKTGDGSLMDGSTMHEVNDTRLSECSLDDIRKEFEAGNLDCLLNVPPMRGTRLPGLMPGKVSNIFEQCKARGYGPPCLPNQTYVDVCSKLWCTLATDVRYCISAVDPTSAGSTCLLDNWTEYGVCLKNRCTRV